MSDLSDVTVVNLSIPEDTLQSGIVATFSDANPTDTTADFTATIDWGDGTTSTGITPSSSGAGSFTVSGAHTYVDEGNFSPIVTLTRTTDNVQAAAVGTIQVTENDAIIPNATVIHANPNQPFTGVVATFSDPLYPGQVASDFTATIDWLDGTTSIGTISGASGTFTVTGTHTFTAAGPTPFIVTLSDDAPGTASIPVVDIADVGFLGAIALGSVIEGTPISAGSSVATFADDDTTDSAASFTATIDWGDGTTETGVVAGAAGNFTVLTANGHTYADEGNVTPVVTLTHTSDGVTATFTGTVAVGEGDAIIPASTVIHANPNQPFTGVVATFSDPLYPGQVASDFTATIDWLDGTTSTGTISGASGTFTVTGTHTFTAAGPTPFIVTLSDDAPGTASIPVVDIADVGFLGTGAPLGTVEGIPISAGTAVATFADDDATDSPASFTATIDWGDGTTETGVVTGGPGSFTVLTAAGHTYADEGVFTATTTITHIADNVTGTATGTVTVAEGDTLIAGVPNFFHVNPTQAFTGVVGTFIDPTNLSQVASDFTATINWGDGTPLSTATITGGSGSFTVSGSHTYAAAGVDFVTVTLSDDAPGTAVATVNSTAAVGFAGTLALLPQLEGFPIAPGVPIATFMDPDPTDTVANFTATIDWGDGTTTPGVVNALPGIVGISSAGHVYADEGSFTPIVTLSHLVGGVPDGVTGTATGTVAVAEGDILTPLPALPIAPNPNQPFSAVLGTFSNTNLNQVASDFTATIDWGDGTTSTGTVTGGGLLFSVSGTHTYATSGTDTIVTTLRDDAPGTASASIVRSNVMVGFPGAFALSAATEQTPLPANTTVATFSDPNLADTASGFTATIDWGDGTTTAGAVVGSLGLFAVDGGHTYRVEGNFQATATLTRTADNDTGVAKGTIAVAEGPTIPEDFAGTGFSGVLWRQTNPQTFAQNFVQWSMNGANVTASQSDTFQGNVILPDASWTVRGTGDFNGDGKSDVLWQHADGSLTAWLMNDSTIVSDGPLKSQGQIVAPSASWSVAGTGDFDGDARDDVLWRKTDGSLVEWLMNGTTITSTLTPTFHGAAISPDASWSIAAMGDFDGDGHQDIMWRSSSTNALQDWSMNGSTITSSQAPTFQGGPVTPDSSWSIVAAGDFNADNKTDLVWRQAGTGLLQEWQMNGSQIVSSQVIKFQGSQVTPDSSWSLVEIGDFNGDGKSDALWRQSTTGALSEWLMDGAQITASNTVNPALDSSWQVQSKPTNFV